MPGTVLGIANISLKKTNETSAVQNHPFEWGNISYRYMSLQHWVLISAKKEYEADENDGACWVELFSFFFYLGEMYIT